MNVKTALSAHLGAASSAKRASQQDMAPSSGVGEFFRYHGIWAPGVRLFRAIGFRTKATIIALTFLAPMGMLAWSYFNGQADQINFSAKERLGLVYAREVMPLLNQLERKRLALSHEGAKAGAGAELDAAIQAQLLKLAAVEKEQGDALGTAKAYASFLETGKAAANGNDSAAQGKALTAHIQSLLDLLGVATDGSNLTLDPDIDTYYLMDTALFRLPIMIEAAGRIQADGAAALAKHEASPAQTRQLIEQFALLSGNASAIDTGLTKAIAYNADVGKQVKADATLQAVKQVGKQLDNTLLHEQGVQGDAQAHTALAGQSIEAMLKLTQDASAKLDELIQARVDRLSYARDINIAVLILGLLASQYLFMAFRKVLFGGLQEVAAHIEAMRDGNLTTRPRPWGTDEAASLMKTVMEMQESLRRIVSQVRGASHSIANASGEIAHGADDLSVRTEQSAANLEETASAMEQIAATVHRNEETVDTAAKVAISNAQAAERGGLVIDEVVRTMQAINGSSNRISDIIATIDGIAFQTNILALNAAVEAARAGDQGRGFAVVASEVRALAQRSSAAAKEIKVLITSSVEQVEGGMRVVKEAGDTIGEVVATSKRVHELLSEVAVSANQQSAGVQETTKAVQQLDGVTQQNAALVEQTAAAASALKDQAKRLVEEVAQFQLPA